MGNICRSPLAEGIFNAIINNNKTSHLFETDSAGTSDYHIGELSDPRTRNNAKTHGLQLVHKARQLKSEDFTDFDYLIAMDDSNLKSILELNQNKESKVKIYKMRFFDPTNQNADVPDPWFGGEKGFEEVFQILERSCRSFYNSLCSEK